MTSEWAPGRLLELSGSYWQTCTLHAAVRLDLFTLIGTERLTPEAVAARAGANPRAMGMLLNAVTAMGLLEKEEGRFFNSAAAALYLSRDSDRYLGHIISHHYHLVESWAVLDQAVRTGGPVRDSSALADAERRESFLMGMFNLASLLAPVLVKQIDLKGRRRLLDLGGGPGTYAIHFCRQNPELQAVVFDLPETRPFAEATIARFGLQERIEFVEGNFLQDRAPGTYDVVWLSHVLHGEGPEGCARLLEHAAATLQPGGVALVHEFILDDDLAGPLFPALFSLNMLLGTEAGQAYSGAQIAGMMKVAGMREVHRLPLDIPSPSGVVAGVAG